MTAFSINTVFGAIDKFSGPLGKMEAANKQFARTAETSFGNLGKKIVNVREHLIALAANLSMAAIIALGFNAIKDYDKALASLSAITGITGKAFIPFKAEVLDVATKTKMSAVDVAKAFELVGSAKSELLSDAKALGVVSQAAIYLSKASGDDLESSTLSLVGVMNQFNLKADQSTRIINALAAGSIVGAATTGQVNEAIRAFGTGAEMMNVSLEQSVSLVEVLSQKQIVGAEAGTKLRNVLSKMSSAKGLPKEALDQMHKMGININMVSNKAVPFEKRLQEIAKAVKDPVAMLKIFGEENKEAASVVLTNIGLFKDWTKQVTGTNSAYEQAAIRSKTFTTRIEELKNKFINLAISGNETSGTLNVFGNIIGFVTNNLGLIIGAIGIASGAYLAYWAVMKTGLLIQGAYNIATGISLAIQGYQGILLLENKTALTAYTIATKIYTAGQWIANTAAWAFTAALLANPITWIVVGILALGGAIVWIATHWEKFVGWLKIGWHWIRQMGKAILGFLLSPLEMVLKLISKLTGAKWADNALGGINKLKDAVGGDEPSKAVNITAASTSAQSSRYEEIKKQQVELQLTNKTDKNITLKSNPAKLPIITATN
jgi:TP901 family phage tail tape measure protein